jgi:Uma2 family endonuclease
MTDTLHDAPISSVPDPSGFSLEEWYKQWGVHDSLEVVEGEVIQLMPPDYSHIAIMTSLFVSLYLFVSQHNLGNVHPDNTPYILDGNPRRKWVKGSRVPDVSFVARERMEAHLAKHGKDGPLYLAPDLAVEIVSKNDSFTDVVKKAQEYLRYGVQMVCVIDPDGRIIYLYTPENSSGIILNEGDTLTADPVIPGWSAPVQSILDGKLG